MLAVYYHYCVICLYSHEINKSNIRICTRFSFVTSDAAPEVRRNVNSGSVSLESACVKSNSSSLRKFWLTWTQSSGCPYSRSIDMTWTARSPLALSSSPFTVDVTEIHQRRTYLVKLRDTVSSLECLFFTHRNCISKLTSLVGVTLSAIIMDTTHEQITQVIQRVIWLGSEHY